MPEEIITERKVSPNDWKAIWDFELPITFRTPISLLFPMAKEVVKFGADQALSSYGGSTLYHAVKNVMADYTD